MKPTPKESQTVQRAFNNGLIGLALICFTAIFCFGKMEKTSSETKDIETLKVKKLELDVRAKEADVRLAEIKSGKPEYRPITITQVDSKAFNTSYQAAIPGRWNIVNFSVSINASLSLSGGQTGTVVLQTSPDNSTWTTVCTALNGSTGTLTLGLNTINSQTVQMLGLVPPFYYYRLSSSGTATIGMVNGREGAF